jgi:hypothetical protein
MDQYLRKYNNQINLIGILNALGKCMMDLPSLDKYCTPPGTSYICWNSMLGKGYHNKQCTYVRGHIVKGDMTDEFADAVMDVISKGMLHYTNLPQWDHPKIRAKERLPTKPDPGQGTGMLNNAQEGPSIIAVQAKSNNKRHTHQNNHNNNPNRNQQTIGRQQ